MCAIFVVKGSCVFLHFLNILGNQETSIKKNSCSRLKKCGLKVIGRLGATDNTCTSSEYSPVLSFPSQWQIDCRLLSSRGMFSLSARPQLVFALPLLVEQMLARGRCVNASTVTSAIADRSEGFFFFFIFSFFLFFSFCFLLLFFIFLSFFISFFFFLHFSIFHFFVFFQFFPPRDPLVSPASQKTSLFTTKILILRHESG